MIAALATLCLGFVIGYVGQRARLCFISGYRDWFLTGDRQLFKGVIGAFCGALAGYIVFYLLGGAVPEFPALSRTPGLHSSSAWGVTVVSGLAVGFVGVLAGGCPFRMHVLAAEGRKTYWYYLLGFYLGLVFFNMITEPFLERILE